MDLIGHFFMDDLGSQLRQETHQIGVSDTVTVKEIDLALFNRSLVAASLELLAT